MPELFQVRKQGDNECCKSNPKGQLFEQGHWSHSEEGSRQSSTAENIITRFYRHGNMTVFLCRFEGR